MKKNRSQMHFKNLKSKLEFGGEMLKQARNRHARPVSSKDLMHVVLKSTRAIGKYSFGHSSNLVHVNQAVEKHCRKYGVKLIKYSNNFNHLHLLLRFPSREIYLRFIRTLSARLATLVTKARKTRSLANIFAGVGARFFDHRPFSRIIKGRKGFTTVSNYIRLNQLEAEGVIEKT